MTTRILRHENPRSGKVRGALTLLEIILTLSLAVVLMGLIGGAMRSYVREMNVRDLELHQTHLATQLMAMIETDLRAAMHPDPIDTTNLEAFLQASSGGQVDAEAGEIDLSAAGIESDDASMEISVEEPLTTTGIVLETPGLIGTEEVLQFDISRLPRLEEYSPLLADGSGRLQDVPSDIKTVAYYVQAAGTIGGVQDEFAKMATDLGLIDSSLDGGGLIRRMIDRAVTVESAAVGGTTQLMLSGKMVAPEVSQIAFQYWDGLTWQPQWDSDLYGELPLAVEIQLTLRTTPYSEEEVPTFLTFRHLVRLPMGKIPAETEETEVVDDPSLPPEEGL